jgi:hypothetical protein
MKNGKRVAIGARPPANPHADAWVRQGDGNDIGKTDLYTARLTLDVTPALRARIKVAAFTRGITVAECCARCWNMNSRRSSHECAAADGQQHGHHRHVVLSSVRTTRR